MSLGFVLIAFLALGGACPDEDELNRLLDQKLLDVQPGLPLSAFTGRFGGSAVTIETRPDGGRSVAVTVTAALSSRRAYRALLCDVDAKDSITSCKAHSHRFHAQTADPGSVERVKKGATLLDVA